MLQEKDEPAFAASSVRIVPVWVQKVSVEAVVIRFSDQLLFCCVHTARLKPMPAPTSSALMHSDSDLDSDDGQNGVPWKEQERGHLLRPQNGSLRNGQGPARSKKQREELL